MAAALRLVLGDQLSRNLAGLADLDPARDVVMMAEVIKEEVDVQTKNNQAQNSKVVTQVQQMMDRDEARFLVR